MPGMKSISRDSTQDPPHQGCHFSTGTRDQSGCHGCAQLLDIPIAHLQGFDCVTFGLLQLGDYPQQCAALSIARQDCCIIDTAPTKLLWKVSLRLFVIWASVMLRTCHRRNGSCKEVSERITLRLDVTSYRLQLSRQVNEFECGVVS